MLGRRASRLAPPRHRRGTRLGIPRITHAGCARHIRTQYSHAHYPGGAMGTSRPTAITHARGAHDPKKLCAPIHPAQELFVPLCVKTSRTRITRAHYARLRGDAARCSPAVYPRPRRRALARGGSPPRGGSPAHARGLTPESEAFRNRESCNQCDRFPDRSQTEPADPRRRRRTAFSARMQQAFHPSGNGRKHR